MEKGKEILNKTPKKRKFRFLRRLLRVFIGILVFLVLLVLFIRSPWGQSLIIDSAVDYVSSKTNTDVGIDKFYISFDGDLTLEGLFLEDKKGDTLIYSKSLEADIPLIKMIQGGAIGVDALNWEGLKANITRKDSVSGFNFQFLIDAFASSESDETIPADTTSTPLNIVLRNLSIKKVDIVYRDEVTGIDSQFKIGQLKASFDALDIENFIFDASELQISDTRIKFIQNLTQKVDTTSSDSPLPLLSAKSVSLNNVRAYFNSETSNIIADLHINKFYTEIPKLDLNSQNFKIASLQLKDSKIAIQTEAYTGLAEQFPVKPITENKPSSNFEWPDLNFSLGSLDLENNNIDYRVGNEHASTAGFNANALFILNSTLKAQEVYFKDKEAGLQLNQFTFKETSGIDLKQLSLGLKLTDKQLTVNDLNFKLNNNTLSGYARFDYPSLSQFINAPENAKIDINLPSLRIVISDFYTYLPELEKNEYIKTLSKKLISGNIQARGKISAINLSNTSINWGTSTQISANGTIENATNVDELYLDQVNFSAKTKRSDIIQFLNEEELGVNLPEQILLNSAITGSLNELSAKAKLTTSQGIANIDARFKNGEVMDYDAVVDIENYQLNELLQNPDLGALSLQVKSKGSGSSLNNLDATVDATISEFTLNQYDIKDLILKGEIKNGEGKLQSKFKDNNLNFTLDAFAVLDSIAPEFTADLDLIGVDLQGLGLLNRNVKSRMKLSAKYKGSEDAFDASATIVDGVLVYDNKTFLLGDLNARAHVTQDTTAVSIENKTIELSLQSNSDPQAFSTALQRHVLSYFYRDEKVSDTILKPVNLTLKGKIAQSPLLNDVFFTNLNELDTINIDVNFNEKVRKLKAAITAPHINYGGNELDSLAFVMNTDEDNFNFELGFKNILAGPIDIPRTKISGNQTNNELLLDFISMVDGEKLLNLNTKITGNRERLVFRVIPDELIFNSSDWVVPDDNEIVFTENNIAFQDFKFTKQNQIIEITDNLQNINKNHAALVFKNFKLNELFYYFNPDSKLADGILDASIILEEPYGAMELNADLKIEQLEVLKTDLGTLKLNANSPVAGTYDFNVGVNGGTLDLGIEGNYGGSENSSNLQMEIDLNAFKMEALNTLSLGEVKNGSGYMSGEFAVNGPTDNLQYSGSLTLNDASLKISKLNTRFSMLNETLNIDNSGLSMSKFTVLDESENALVFTGKVGTENVMNPTFDLKINAKNFQVLNATKEENNLIYGKANFDADAKLTGDLSLPKLDAKLKIGSQTNITYVMPASVANIEKSEGVVNFVNRENPDAILTKTEEASATIKGFDISTLINIDENATVNVIINEDTGDNFQASGKGDLILKMDPNGRINLVGTYKVISGHYELNLYKLVRRKFLLAQGSSISWSGDPFDAKLDVRAIYNVETSASSLMASQISSKDPSAQSKFKEVLPFNVFLNIDGELLEPKISFKLDMPEEEQGAIGGQVYTRVQQVNQQEGELNQQVFSLLVLNRFYPNSSNDGSSGGFASLARDNLNDAVSDQLNALSDKVLGDSGFELDFGIDSYTDYQGNAPTDRTQLDIAAQKKLFNDRLIVRVGSEVDIEGGDNVENESAPIIGNASLEYILTEDGRYRIKGFRKNEYENVIDGQTVVSGIAIIFTQEFNQFTELWDAIFKKQQKEEKVKKESTDQNAGKKDEN